ncbi:SRPBCC family protein [Maritimibacter sp. UBA3975]|uniref:SRPBCC family protein n=1 Tax=Maritimibacter sp. UBA3975 TaxID=1946833 RepID=UPI000C094178|nr:SRPBCC family protein [Maritimibacter sp. UBA3975]MAM62384.1 hypothetical protein [Maritimibacter sp.]|tara:strand:- start:4280 stop:4717 length:438 start_codon:yes stop_codon:yes gene_type:complete
MKYIERIVIDRPRDAVVALFDDPDNLAKWQEGLVSFTHLSGEPGREGSQSKLVFRMGSRTIEMVETLEVRALPDRFTAVYEADGMWNRNENHFEELDDGATEWTMLCEFQPSNFLLKVMAIVTPGMFKKQTRNNMEAFKEFAEGR